MHLQARVRELSDEELDDLIGLCRTYTHCSTHGSANTVARQINMVLGYDTAWEGVSDILNAIDELRSAPEPPPPPSYLSIHDIIVGMVFNVDSLPYIVHGVQSLGSFVFVTPLGIPSENHKIADLATIIGPRPVEVTDLQPVPLTVEWLDRLELEKVSDKWYHTQGTKPLRICLAYRTTEEGWLIRDDHDGLAPIVHSVHALQRRVWSMSRQWVGVKDFEYEGVKNDSPADGVVILSSSDPITLDSQLRLTGEKQPLPMRRLVAIKADDSYCRLIVDGGDPSILMSRSLGWMERRLATMPLVRLSRQHIVRLDRIVHIENGLVLMDTQQTFPVSRRFLHPVQLALDKWQQQHP